LPSICQWKDPTSFLFFPSSLSLALALCPSVSLHGLLPDNPRSTSHAISTRSTASTALRFFLTTRGSSRFTHLHHAALLHTAPDRRRLQLDETTNNREVPQAYQRCLNHSIFRPFSTSTTAQPRTSTHNTREDASAALSGRPATSSRRHIDSGHLRSAFRRR
jgi:hypothetical protein